MFRRRKVLQHRDRESGLAFSWRVPLSSGGSMFAAFTLVALGAVVLSAAVRVNVGRPNAEEAQRASVIMIPRGSGGERIEQKAREAGPFPVRWNPAADPEYASLRSRALREAGEVGLPYRPAPRSIEFSSSGWPSSQGRPIAVLPPLPERLVISKDAEGPREVAHGLRVLKSKEGVSLLHASLILPAAESVGIVGVRYLIEYDRDGRVLEVTRMDSGDPQASVVSWVERARVEGNQGEPGLLVVESVIGS